MTEFKSNFLFLEYHLVAQSGFLRPQLIVHCWNWQASNSQFLMGEKINANQSRQKTAVTKYLWSNLKNAVVQFEMYDPEARSVSHSSQTKKKEPKSKSEILAKAKQLIVHLEKQFYFTFSFFLMKNVLVTSTKTTQMLNEVFPDLEGSIVQQANKWNSLFLVRK